jgi:hypothetical protein
MVDRKALFAGERAAFEADYPEIVHQVPHWIDVAERAFGVRADAIEERVRVLEEAGTTASTEQIAEAAQLAARFSLVDAAAAWQKPAGKRRR